MLALAEYRASMCPCGCGHLMADTTAAEGSVRFQVPTPQVCLARLKLAETQKTYADAAAQGRAFPTEVYLWQAVKG